MRVEIDQKYYPLGAYQTKKGIIFSFVSKEEPCGVLIYDKKTGRILEKIVCDPRNRMGFVHWCFTEKFQGENISYQIFQGDEKIWPDPHGKAFLHTCPYGRLRKETDLRTCLPDTTFDWGEDRTPKIPYRDGIGYLVHVRGFTRHASSGVAHRGTFLGVAEKADYLQKLGINMIELQPAYEFVELEDDEEQTHKPVQLNYWGYKKGFYYAPKASYGWKNPILEMKQMVKKLHETGIEVIMQFYFPRHFAESDITDILRFWVQEYHVDGFHLIGSEIPAEMIMEDPYLAETKLWNDSFDTEHIYRDKEVPAYRNLAFYQHNYMYTLRKYLKGDEGMVSSVLNEMRYIPKKAGRIHYLTNYNEFTLMDLVSYDRKHNEENQEENRDGNDYNCSWNCGEEGKTRKQKVNRLRVQQIKNAMCMLLLSQSTPLLFMGDEFGNSQKGNNNPYCQDNEITWLDWKGMEQNQELLQFWIRLVTFRKSHPVFHMDKEPRIMDYLACGYPDLSYHGESAWRPQTEPYSRYIGMMYCGKYGEDLGGDSNTFFYVAMNSHWETHKVGLPKLPKGLQWKLELSTSLEEIGTDRIPGEISARTVMVFVSEAEKVPPKSMKKQNPVKKRDKKGNKQSNE